LASNDAAEKQVLHWSGLLYENVTKVLMFSVACPKVIKIYIKINILHTCLKIVQLGESTEIQGKILNVQNFSADLSTETVDALKVA
jgi:hypothetical protein